MSADAFVAYIGLRFEIPSDEIDGIERRSDLRMVAARKVGLRCYWGDFGHPDRYVLFVGRELGVFGVENADEASFSPDEVRELLKTTQSKLAQAGLEGVAALHLKWVADA